MTAALEKSKNIFKKFAGRRQIWIQLSLIVLTLISMSPSLRAGTPRADQLILYNQMKGESLVSLIQNSLLSWNRVHYSDSCGLELSCSDLVLFLPGTYLVQAFLIAWFPYSFEIWQSINLVAHLLVVIGVFQLLRKLGPSSGDSGPAMFAAVFAVNFPGSEMIYWNHLLGYTIFAALLIWAACLGVIALGHRSSPARYSYGAVALLILSQYFYELGFVCLLAVSAVCLYSFAVRPSRRKLRLSFTLVIGAIFYLFLNIFSASVTNWGKVFDLPDTSAGSPNSIISTGYTQSAYWIVEFFSPQVSQFSVGERPIRFEYGSLVMGIQKTFNLGFLFLILSLISITIFIHWRKARRNAQRKFAFVVSLGAMLCAVTYSIIIFVGRSSQRGIDYTLGTNLYYSYFFVLFLVIGAGALVLGYLPRDKFNKNYLRRFATALCLAIVVLQAPLTYRLGANSAKYLEPRQKMIDRIIQLKSVHPNAVFLFTFEPYDENIPCNADVGVSEDHLKSKLRGFGPPTYADLLFPEVSSLYQLAYNEERIQITAPLPCPQTNNLLLNG